MKKLLFCLMIGTFYSLAWGCARAEMVSIAGKSFNPQFNLQRSVQYTLGGESLNFTLKNILISNEIKLQYGVATDQEKEQCLLINPLNNLLSSIQCKQYDHKEVGCCSDLGLASYLNLRIQDGGVKTFLIPLPPCCRLLLKSAQANSEETDVTIEIPWDLACS